MCTVFVVERLKKQKHAISNKLVIIKTKINCNFPTHKLMYYSFFYNILFNFTMSFFQSNPFLLYLDFVILYLQ